MLIEAVLVLGGLALLFGLVIGLATKKYAIKIDPRVKKVTAIMPGMNCGACGFASCEEVATAVVKGKLDANACVLSRKNQEMVEKIKQVLNEE